MTQPTNERVKLTAPQVERLNDAIILYPSRTWVDRDGITRTSSAVINDFVSSLARFYREHGYLTAKQYARIACIVEVKEVRN